MTKKVIQNATVEDITIAMKDFADHAFDSPHLVGAVSLSCEFDGETSNFNHAIAGSPMVLAALVLRTINYLVTEVDGFSDAYNNILTETKLAAEHRLSPIPVSIQ